MSSTSDIEVLGARQHNLKNFNVRFPKGRLSVVTGPSGSGKSSLAFNTLFAEGQRRYLESLSTYARQFMAKHEKPDVDDIRGICPTIALEQKNHTKNSRSTVGTATEIYDYFRLLFSKLGQMFDPETGKIVKRDIVVDVLEKILKDYNGQKIYWLFPLDVRAQSTPDERARLLASYLERGFTKILMPQALKAKGPLEFLELEDQIKVKKGGILNKISGINKPWILVDRMEASEEFRGRIEEAIVGAYREGLGRAIFLSLDDDNHLLDHKTFTEFPSVDGEEKRFPELSPQLFSFNSPVGACARCHGFGNVLTLDPTLVIPNPNLSISQGAVEPFTKPSARDWLRDLLKFCQAKKISLNMRWKDLEKKDQDRVWNGEKDFAGIKGMFAELEDEKYKIQTRVFISRYRSPQLCVDCGGERLCKEARFVKFHSKNISELCAMSVEDLALWFQKLKLSSTETAVAKDVLPQITQRLDFLLRVGLGYLTLNRLAKTLSGGEAQRIALANQLGSRLTQTCYVLDEPSIGLHPQDTEKLISILRDLSALKNAVVVVEHDSTIISVADHLVDIGPFAGERGGELMYQGDMKTFMSKDIPGSSTWRFLSGKDHIPIPQRRRLDRVKDQGRRTNWLSIKGCRSHNLKDVELKIPLGVMTCVTGVSGSGKSTAVRKTLYPALAKIFMQDFEEIGIFDQISSFESIKSVVLIDQQPIGRSSRSNPVTFMKAFDEIRSLFANLSEAKKRNYHAGFFSFNVPGGRCEHCEGEGYTRVEMLFMEDMYLLCEHCEGKRFTKEVLEIRFQGKNIHDILNLTVSEARIFFASQAKLNVTLKTLERVGLGYLRLGQSSTTLSGGESQRLKIARELSRSDNKGVFYILDEPTTGLHVSDVKVLGRVLNELVEQGNSVVVIEHNMELVKCADWVIDFGPGGGKYGGSVLDEGTPEDVGRRKKGPTGEFLLEALKNSPALAVEEFLRA
ncbi:MAG: excinuclease ABC subunit UvrA [Proteobacteria bacterium]|nr:excinuclease ABC subunit UvrA [Pseudomonadota bacterium]